MPPEDKEGRKTEDGRRKTEDGILPPSSSLRPPTSHVYPITQAELAEYRQLDGECRRQLSILTYRRGQICAGMGGSDVVEPGGLKPVITYRDTGRFTLTEEGLVPVIERHLAIVEDA